MGARGTPARPELHPLAVTVDALRTLGEGLEMWSSHLSTLADEELIALDNALAAVGNRAWKLRCAIHSEALRRTEERQARTANGRFASEGRATMMRQLADAYGLAPNTLYQHAEIQRRILSQPAVFSRLKTVDDPLTITFYQEAVHTDDPVRWALHAWDAKVENPRYSISDLRRDIGRAALQAAATSPRTSALRQYLADPPPLTSVLAYGEHGPWGDPKYPGACSGYVLLPLLTHYKPQSVLDPMEGSGTARDLCADYGVEYAGYDLRQGFDLQTNTIPGLYDLIFWHPPLWNTIRYSDNRADLSTIADFNTFLDVLVACADKLWRENLAVGGHLALLVSDIRKDNMYYFLGGMVLTALVDKTLRDLIIVCPPQHGHSAGQHNVIPITHQYLAILHKG